MGFLRSFKIRFDFLPPGAAILWFALFGCASHLAAQTVAINEVMASNADVIADDDGDYSDWIELYNYGHDTLNLEGFGITDDLERPFRWIFPEYHMAPGAFLLIWASGKDRRDPQAHLHTNFSISSAGEPVLLFRPDSAMINAMNAVEMPTGISYGRQPDGTGPWGYFYEPTPGVQNFTEPFAALIPPPAFSHSSGFYEDPFELSLSVDNESAVIVYTTDGSEPDISNLEGTSYFYRTGYVHSPHQEARPFQSASYTSEAYSRPLTVYDRSTDSDKLSSICTDYSNYPNYFPDGPVQKGTVVRAAAFLNGARSPIVSHTYFVSEQGAFDHDLPVVSLSLNEDELFDYEKGIYVPGVDFDQWREDNPDESVGIFTPANYFRRGRETEKPSVFQYFENRTELINQNIGIRIHGGWSRTLRHKSLRLYPRNAYDEENALGIPIFGIDGGTDFKRLLLRSSGNDYNLTYMRDAFLQASVSHLNFDTQAYRPMVLYINGEYFGMTNARERYDKFYIERVYGIEEGELDFLNNNAEVAEGDSLHFIALREDAAQADFSDEGQMEYFKTLIDFENFTDYHIAQIYIDNRDWPGNNVRLFRKRLSGFDPFAPPGQDGRWRWMMFDTDFGAGFLGPENYKYNTLAFATSPHQYHYANPEWATLLLRKFLENEGVKIDFVNRFADLMNTAFLPERMEAVIDSLAANIASERHLHAHRWSTLENWEAEVEVMRQFVNLRPAYQREHLREEFGLAGMYDLTLDVSDTDHGYVRLNSIDVNGGTPGVPNDTYPWSGVYFNGIPVRISAVAAPGYRFVRWEGEVGGTAPVIKRSFAGDVYIKAVFEKSDPAAETVLHYWHFNTLSGEHAGAVLPDESYNGDARIYYPGPGPGYMDAVEEGSELNAKFNEPAGSALRVRNPSQTRSLLIEGSTSRFEDIRLSYAARRTTNGADRQTLHYRTAAGQPFVKFATVALQTDFELYSFDFSGVPGAVNNPHFAVRIDFAGINAAGLSGNNRFDNISIEGVAMVPGDCETLSSDGSSGLLDCPKITLEVAPNPSSGLTYLSFSTPFGGLASLDVYDLNGRSVASLQQVRAISQNVYRVPFDTSGLNSGVYLVRLTTAREVAAVRLLVLE